MADELPAKQADKPRKAKSTVPPGYEFPAWFYPPVKGQAPAAIFNKAEDVPEGWVTAPWLQKDA